MLYIRSICYCLLLVSTISSAANILAFLPMPSNSLARSLHIYFRELTNRGHNVTVVSITRLPSPVPPTYKDIIIDNLLEKNNSICEAVSSISSSNPWYTMYGLWQFGLLLTEEVMQLPQTQQLIHSRDQTFDLVIATPYLMQPAFVALGHKFKAPVINVFPNAAMQFIGYMTGNTYPYAYIPDFRLSYSNHMTFWERVVNTAVGVSQVLGDIYYFIPRQEAILKRYLNDPTLPSLYSMLRNISVTFIDSHLSIHYTRPYLPGCIEIGGLTIPSENKLPEDLQKLMDTAKDGVIYFSLGSNFKSVELKQEIKKTVLSAFHQLNQLVLWKFEAETLPDLPSNVKIAKWFPQTDILAHPNCRAFITHGGVHSLMETIHYGVPIIGFPLFGDQLPSMMHMHREGVGIYMAVDNMTVESLVSAINSVLYNSSYKENAHRLQRIFRDRPLSPLQSAVYWTEYLLRHKGAPHLMSTAVTMPFYKEALLDVIAFYIFIFCSFIYILYLLCQYSVLCIKVFVKRWKTKPVKVRKRKKKSD